MSPHSDLTSTVAKLRFFNVHGNVHCTCTVRALCKTCAKPQLLATLDDVAHKAALLGRAGTKRTDSSESYS